MSLVDLGKRLLETAKRGDTEEVRTLMSNGAPFTTDWLGTSPLHFASQYGHLSTAEILLRAGISRDARTKVDRTPLHVAAQEGHLEVVELLLRNGADVEAKDMLKMSPLHWAVEKGNVDVIITLLKQGADVNTSNKFDKTPLDIAIQNGRADLVQVLQFGVEGVHVNDMVDVPSEPSKIEEVTTTEEIGPEDEVDEQVVIASPVAMVPGMTEAEQAQISEDQSSTSVLATLAALAEATAPFNAAANANTTAADTLNWLETQGITMISNDSSSDNSTMISSAIESGQILQLTEGGKLALNTVKQQVLSGADGEEIIQETIIETGEEGHDGQLLETVVDEDGHYTIVTEDGVADDGTIIVSADHGELETDENGEPSLKRMRLHPADGIGGETIVVSSVDDLANQDELRRQLEAMQRQAEEFKAQLQHQKEKNEAYEAQLKALGKSDS